MSKILQTPALPNGCPQCHKTEFTVSRFSHIINTAEKHDFDEKYSIHPKKGMAVRSYVCDNCSHVIFFKETYDSELM